LAKIELYNHACTYVATVSLTWIYVLAKIELHALAKSMLTKLYTLGKAYHLGFTVWPRMHLSTTIALKPHVQHS